MIYTARQFEYYFLQPRTMDEHSVPTLAMDEFDWILSAASSSLEPNSTPSYLRPSNLCACSSVCQPIRGLEKAPFRRYNIIPAYVRPLFVAPKYQTDVRTLSWYNLVTYLGVGRCVIYTASGSSALGCVNHAASYTLVWFPDPSASYNIS